MADITTFPTITKVLVHGDNIGNFKAGETIKAGQVVGIAATGESMTVVVMDGTSGEKPFGVALHNASSGDYLAVALVGCIVYVANEDDTTAIDAGSWLEATGTMGTVLAANETPSGATVTPRDCIGIALDDIPGGGTGRCLIMPFILIQPNAS